VAGALLVAPADVDRADAHETLRQFAPAPRVGLPFPSILAASEDDPYITLQRSFDLAREWGSHFVNIGAHGHVNAASGIGWWVEGQRLLERLVGVSERRVAHAGGYGDVLALLATTADAPPG